MKLYHRLLVWDIDRAPAVTRVTEQVLNPVLGKSLVVYATKPVGRDAGHAGRDHRAPVAPTRLTTGDRSMRLPEVPGDPDRRRGAARPSTPSPSWQLPNGMIPWFPGGHADPWNHVEAAMALALGGRRAEAERAYDWLVDVPAARRLVAPVLPGRLDRAGQARRQRHRLRGHRRVAPLPAVRRRRLRRDACGRSSSAAIDFVLDLQTPRGEILWARHADGTPWSFALLTGSLEHLPQPALRHRHRRAPRPRASRLGAERGPAGPRHPAHVAGELPDAFAPKHRWAMDWYYPVLTGVRRAATAGLERLDARRDTFFVEDMGVRCVSDRPWITAAETCECLLAYLVARRARPGPRAVRAGPSSCATDDGHYWTGIVFPEMVHFPGNERRTYTAASIVLAADALERRRGRRRSCSSTTTCCRRSSTPTRPTSPPIPASRPRPRLTSS